MCPAAPLPLISVSLSPNRLRRSQPSGLYWASEPASRPDALPPLSTPPRCSLSSVVCLATTTSTSVSLLAGLAPPQRDCQCAPLFRHWQATTGSAPSISWWAPRECVAARPSLPDGQPVHYLRRGDCECILRCSLGRKTFCHSGTLVSHGGLVPPSLSPRHHLCRFSLVACCLHCLSLRLPCYLQSPLR